MQMFTEDDEIRVVNAKVSFKFKFMLFVNYE